MNLTGKGRDLIEQGIEERYRWVDDLAGKLNPEESEQISEALKLMMRAAQELESEPVH